MDQVAPPARHRAEQLSRAFASSLAMDPRPVAGVEHEYTVHGLDGHQLDFGALVGSLDLGGGRALDPGDVHAVRGDWGGAITADGPEAEVVTPPVGQVDGFSSVIDSFAARGRDVLGAALGAERWLTGFSTHVNIEVPIGSEVRVAWLFVTRFAPAMMLLLDRPWSPGLLVRPRPGRLELCGEFAEGEDLQAAIVFACGAAEACLAALDRPVGRLALPPRVAVRAEAAVERYGWFVGRDSFGVDLYACGRATELRMRHRRTRQAQRHFEDAWRSGRPHAEARCSAAELAIVDATIAGDRPLPTEATADHQRRVDYCDGSAQEDGQVFPCLLNVKPRPEFSVSARVLTWDFAVMELTGPRVGFAVVPRSRLAAFTDGLAEGKLDVIIAGFLAQRGGDRVLGSADEAREPGLFDTLGAPAQLLASERDAVSGRLVGAGGSGAAGRPGKGRERPDEPPTPGGVGPAPKQGRPAWVIVAIAVAAMVLVAALVRIAAGGDDGGGGLSIGSDPGGEPGVGGSPAPNDLGGTPPDFGPLDPFCDSSTAVALPSELADLPPLPFVVTGVEGTAESGWIIDPCLEDVDRAARWQTWLDELSAAGFTPYDHAELGIDPAAGIFAYDNGAILILVNTKDEFVSVQSCAQLELDLADPELGCNG